MEAARPVNNNLNTGYVKELPQPQDHVLGGRTVAGDRILGKPSPDVIFNDGHGWIDADGAERGESQANDGFDSFMCTIYGVGGAISDYMKKAYYEDIDFSECIQGVLAGVQPGVGGTIRNSIESFRTLGWAEESYRKFTESTTQAQCFAVVTEAVRNIAKNKLDDWEIYWDIIDTSDDVPHAKIIEALKKYEVIVAGYAWASYYGNVGVFHSYNHPANHCFRIGDGGNISNDVKSKFEGRDYAVDWSLVDLIAIDSYRYDWRKDPENDHHSLNDFLKPLSKEYRIESAYGVYVLPKSKKKTTFSLMLKNMQEHLWSYADSKGVYFFFVKEYNAVLHKQQLDISKLPPELVALKALFVLFGETEGATRKTSYGEVSQIPNHKFF